MTYISLLSGEGLRSENGRAAPIVQRGYARRFAHVVLAGWLRMHRAGVAIGRRFAQARREETQARQLAQLDARILRDIGLDADSGHPLAGRVDAYRRQQRLHEFAARLGL